MMMMECIERLGARIEDRWRSVDYDLQQFADICVHALKDAALPDRIAADDILEWALQAQVLPQQQDPHATFGQPPVTLFNGRRFFIDALFWLDATTSIHQHAFSGAFQVLHGSSIETRYSYVMERKFDGNFALGTLSVKESLLRNAGDIAQICSGPDGLIHALFHLEKPSVTLVIRTRFDPNAGPQYGFLWPGIASNPFFAEATSDRALQLVTMLVKLEHPKRETWIGELVAKSDPHTAFRILSECSKIKDQAMFDRLIDRVADSSISGVFRTAFQEARRLVLLTRRRTLVTDADLRFFMGVLLNAPRREMALTLVRARVSEANPAKQTAAWLRQLSGVNAAVQVRGVAWEPNLFGLPEFDDQLESALACELSGAPISANEVTADRLQKLRTMPVLACLFR